MTFHYGVFLGPSKIGEPGEYVWEKQGASWALESASVNYWGLPVLRFRVRGDRNQKPDLNETSPGFNVHRVRLFNKLGVVAGCSSCPPKVYFTGVTRIELEPQVGFSLEGGVPTSPDHIVSGFASSKTPHRKPVISRNDTPTFVASKLALKTRLGSFQSTVNGP